MDCHDCGQHDAEVQYTEVVGGQKEVQWLCTACAGEHGLLVVQPVTPGPEVAPEPDAATTARLRRRCEGCHTSLGDIRRSGRVGCPVCYETFADHLERLLKRVHGCVEHVGRRSTTPDDTARSQRELLRLRSDLARAVADEDFEAAARLRDAIRATRGSRPEDEV